MSSHREAPEISKDPVADSTDLYAFMSPDRPGTVTLIANYIPLEAPDGGPNFYEFADDVLYSINIDNTGDGFPDISYQFRFSTVNNTPGSFLYNDAPITALTPPSPNSSWNRQQTYTLTRVDMPWNRWRSQGPVVLGSGLLCPPCNIGPLSTPNYAGLAGAAVHSVGAGPFSAQVFAGQRAEGFYVDLGAVFDLGDLRGFAGAHAGGAAAGLMNGMPGVNSTADVNVHTLALQIPVSQLTRSTPSGPGDPAAVIGVWTTASRQRVRVRGNGQDVWDDFDSGPWTQVSRLGNPLTNELLIGIGDKDRWNSLPPTSDGGPFLNYFAKPLLPQLLPTLYPGVFPNLAAYNSGVQNTRPDIEAIFLTGIPAGVITPAPTFTNYNGTGIKADMLRLNTAIAPATSPNSLGLLGLDVAGYPNGRRVFDDVATIALRAVAGATLGFVAPSFTADAAAGEVDFGLTTGDTGTDLAAKGTEHYLSNFPYLGTPYSGFSNPAATPVSVAP
ncbi:MAG TPA: DUF4331 domain-containing protein [Acidimicrobiales bacterium]|nr:DUF4331 domain-containing protein [Acidimicrobiales bacterium]